MQFIRQNLFLVVVAGVFVVGAGILLAMNYKASEDIDTNQIQPRANLARDIGQFRRDGAITTEQLIERKARLEELKKTSQSVADECRDWNYKSYAIIQLNANVDGKMQKIPAFPVKDQYTKYGSLYWNFIEVYLGELQALRASLEPAALVTQEEAEKEVDRVTKVMEDEEIHRRAKEAKQENPATAPAHAPALAPGGGGPGMAPGMGPGMGPGGMGPGGMGPGGMGSGTPGKKATGPRLSSDVTADISVRAHTKAFETLALRQATRGKTFVNPDAFDYVFTAPQPNGSFKQLWDAQINLWAQKDIVEAIKTTNQQVLTMLKGPDGKSIEADATHSAVKRLLKIAVEEQYYVASSGAPAPGQTPAAAPGGMGGGGMGGMSPPSGGGAPGGASEVATVQNSFTQHSCNKDCDVVQYTFKVIMPARYIPTLETNLMQRNLHTLLKVEVAPPTVEGSNSSGSTGSTGPVVPLYYGPDAVMEVTFQGELLLLTSWERGTYDETAKKWSDKWPPLIPKEALSINLQAAPNAIRKEDLLRLNQPEK